MKDLLVCIDGSAYADNVCTNAAWVAKRLDVGINLLHVLRRHSDYQAPADRTGAIGLGARSGLLEKLSKVDEERGRLDQQKGQAIIQHGEEILKEAGVKDVHVTHRRGSLVETVKEFETSAEMIFMGSAANTLIRIRSFWVQIWKKLRVLSTSRFLSSPLLFGRSIVF